MKKTKDAKCVFLKDKVCSIYQIRPMICRFYPFQLNMRNNSYTFTYTNECKGIGKGLYIKKNYFERLFTIFSKIVREEFKTEN
jgi:Fe-S-cluster containining protein